MSCLWTTYTVFRSERLTKKKWMRTRLIIFFPYVCQRSSCLWIHKVIFRNLFNTIIIIVMGFLSVSPVLSKSTFFFVRKWLVTEEKNFSVFLERKHWNNCTSYAFVRSVVNNNLANGANKQVSAWPTPKRVRVNNVDINHIKYYKRMSLSCEEKCMNA